MGIAFYIGDTGTGKTTKAEQDAGFLAGSRGCPLILCDSEGILAPKDALIIKAPESRPEEDAALDLLRRSVWEQGRHVAYTPRDDEDAARLFDMVRAGGACILLIDEASYWARGVQIVPSLLRLSRVNRHSGVDIFMTTQYPADLNPLLWNVKREVYVFRNGGEAALDRLQEELRLTDEEVERIRTLPDYEFLKWSASAAIGARNIDQHARKPSLKGADAPPPADAGALPSAPPAES